VPWTKPEDLPYCADKKLPELGGIFSDGFHAVLFDGSVRFLPRTEPEAALRKLITRN
jgi:hypothetical protein